MIFFRTHFFAVGVLLLLKAYFLRSLVLRDYSFWASVLLEYAGIVALCALAEMAPRKIRASAFFSLNLFFSIFCVAILLYYRFFGRMMTHYAVFSVGQVDAVSGSVFSVAKISDALFFADLAIWAFLAFFKRWPLAHAKKSRPAALVFLSLAVGACALSIGAKKNEETFNSLQRAGRMGILNYEISDVSNSVSKAAPAPAPSAQTPIDALKEIKPVKNPKLFGAAKDKNLILIQIESFQNFLIGLKVGEQEVTPNLNKLAKESLYFPKVFTQIGQGNTSDAEFMANTSLYPLENGVISQLYADREFPSLPKLLKEKGYAAVTFHTNKASFYNRENMYPALGYDKYYDQSFFGKDDAIGMASSDSVLFSKSMSVLKEKKKAGQKFYANYVTLSSHSPFILPAGKSDLKLPDDFKNTQVGNYLSSARYADQEIGKFIAELKKEGLWDDAALAFYGDHFAIGSDIVKPDQRKLLESLLGRTYDSIDMFNVPFAVRVPGMAPQTLDKTGGQVDILPTIANLLGVSLDKQVHFGQDLVNYSSNLVGERFYLPQGSFFNDDVLYIPKSGMKDQATALKTRQPEEDAQTRMMDYVRVSRLMGMSDAYIAGLPKRSGQKVQ